MRYVVKGLKVNAGTNGGGAIDVLTIEARDDHEARLSAISSGLSVVSIRQAGGLAERLRARRTRFELLLFSQELVSLMQAGVGLVEAFEALAEKESRRESRAIVLDLLSRLRQGKTLSAAMEYFPYAFPPLYIAAVRASERSGGLIEALSRFNAYQSRIDSVKKKMIAASIYPALLICAATLVMLFLLGYVVPRFSHIYADMGDGLPLLSRWLLKLGETAEVHGLWLLAGVAGVALTFWLAADRSRTSHWGAQLLMRIPAMAAHLRVYYLSRFYRSIGMLLSGGTAVLPALGMASGLLPDFMQHTVRTAERLISEGRAISDVMESAGLATPIALRLLRVGERTGELGMMMEKIALFHDDEIERWLDWSTRLIEPLLMTIIGLMVGAVVVLMYMPIFDLAGHIQ